uniref:RING-type domain-containing protein n=1 Tax=viral metagenome TaxID=1070528 RepID=A0A6C0DNG5_9ZZZZ
MSENRIYQRVYGVGLLDDLHNYFPALLYDQNRFQTLPEAFQYVREQMFSRFQPLEHEPSTELPSPPTHLPPPSFAHTAPPLSYRHPRTRSSARRNDTSRQGNPISIESLSFENEIEVENNLSSVALLLNLMNQGISQERTSQQRSADAWRAFRSPVLVVPSAADISGNTELVPGSPTLTTICTICQDRMFPAETCRRLLPCQHTFHQSCIDQWFEQNVRCPTCRHDIRERVPVQPVSTDTQSTN